MQGFCAICFMGVTTFRSFWRHKLPWILGQVSMQTTKKCLGCINFETYPLKGVCKKTSHTEGAWNDVFFLFIQQFFTSCFFAIKAWSPVVTWPSHKKCFSFQDSTELNVETEPTRHIQLWKRWEFSGSHNCTHLFLTCIRNSGEI